MTRGAHSVNQQPPLNNPAWAHFASAAGGALLGAFLLKNHLDESRKSRAEQDDPEGIEDALEEIDDVLKEWRPSGFEAEDEFTEDLADILDECSSFEIDVAPGTREGKPDILVGDLVALELKLCPTKAELDRCVGQCARYSRQWRTIVLLIGASASTVGALEDLLADKGLDHIQVISYA